VVHETTRVAGTAEVDPVYELRVNAHHDAAEPVVRIV